MNTILENNHTDMKTVVETFLVEETISLIYDGEQLNEWRKQVENLGLKGQEDIAKPEKSPIPFLHIKQNLENILETLCPVKVEVSKYSTSPIPLEILKLITLSGRENYFSKIEIWYDDVKPDPVCVGYIGHYYEMDWYTDSNKDLKNLKFSSEEELKNKGGKHPIFTKTALYLIGKWGDVKRPFQELAQMATERFLNQKGIELKQRIKDTQRELDDLELEASKRFLI